MKDDRNLNKGSMFRDPTTNKEYRIGSIEGDTYIVIDLTNNTIIKWKKDRFEPLEYIGSYDFRTGSLVAGKSKRRQPKRQTKRQTKRRKSRSHRHLKCKKV